MSKRRHRKRNAGWWTLPVWHPVRIHCEFNQARKAYRDARPHEGDEPSQWEYDLLDTFGIEPETTSERDLHILLLRYVRAHDLYMAAGCPTFEGKKRRPMNRKLFRQLIAERIAHHNAKHERKGNAESKEV